MVASEAVPFAKTGGLGDVAGALPLALARLGHEVTLVLPRYRGVEAGAVVDRTPVTVAGRTFEVAYWEEPLADGVRAVLVECPELYARPELYGHGNTDYADNAVRFAVLARAALEFGARQAKRPDVVHAHDWQAGLVPVYLRTLYRDHPVLGGLGSVFTIHNLAYQGLFPPSWVPALDLNWDLFGIEGIEYWGKVSFLKGGINFSDVITTVSPRYAKEIQTPEFGFGFDGILARRAKCLVGILNGIDATAWNPAADRFLPVTYDASNLKAKRANKRALLETMSLPSDEAALKRPVVGMVSRLVDQKGFDLIAALEADLLALPAVYVLLGNGEERYQEQWRRMAAEHPDRVAVRIGFDERLAHLIEAGADLFLMPSRFEPCGLNQMYSLRYGTVPVVRATGGLDDTIETWSARTGRGNGFKFKEDSASALLATLRKALDAYSQPKAWRSIQLAGMSEDHSWESSADAYVGIYEKAMRAAKKRG